MTDDRIKKSLRYSILDGGFAASMVGIGESFFAVFAVFLKANAVQFGILNSLPQALGSVSQLFSNRLIRLFKSRKRLVCTAVLIQALMYIPVTLVFFLGRFRVYHLIFFICLYWFFGMILGPAWNSWMGDLVDEKERGAYFGKRSVVTGFASFVSFMAGGYILQAFTRGTITQYAGFVTIFIIALISRGISFIFLTKKYEPEYQAIQEEAFTLFDFIREAKSRNYGLFVLYLCLMNFSVYLSAPFFTPYMLDDLKFDYKTYTIVNAAAMVVKLLSVSVWGRASDQFGTKKILSLSGFMMPVIPLFWLFSRDVYYLIVIQMFSGFIWAGFEISSFNFIFDTTSPSKRATCVAYYNVLNGLSIFSGAMLGSFIAGHNSLLWSKYLLVFFLSCVLRYTASFVFIPKLREVRAVEEIGYPRLFLKIISTMPTMGTIYQLIPFRKGHEDKQE